MGFMAVVYEDLKIELMVFLRNNILMSRSKIKLIV
jgi:hypothetical protein